MPSSSVFRQEYKQGIPQTGLLTVGLTQDTGTSVTFKPETEMFGRGFNRVQLEERRQQLLSAYPSLSILIYG
ncbi:hypothetical protein [Paenibacillus donghaensis]|uniref:Uncharacterized protein n=1 Tax=Paenibacillus donghaensis TaxID=414771 RepID=A0A2Z2KSX3_9BACL|nr:hypothetical protein [Paenibacillus donghaensis]ASA24762.1 hypothetical protein B9T62_30800 [Paenibacillus donghaensis]